MNSDSEGVKKKTECRLSDSEEVSCRWQTVLNRKCRGRINDVICVVNVHIKLYITLFPISSRYDQEITEPFSRFSMFLSKSMIYEVFIQRIRRME